jgi:hypothetical protein
MVETRRGNDARAKSQQFVVDVHNVTTTTTPTITPSNVDWHDGNHLHSLACAQLQMGSGSLINERFIEASETGLVLLLVIAITSALF